MKKQNSVFNLKGRNPTHGVLCKKYPNFYRTVTVMLNAEPNRVGATLLCYYNNELRIDQLLSEGNIVDLGSEIGQKHDLKKYDLTVSDDCIFKARDGGEPDMDAKISNYVEDVYDIVKQYQAKYLYMWREKAWWVSSGLQPDWQELLENKLPRGIRN